MNQVLRAVGRQVVLLPPWDIPTRGFGTMVVTSRAMGGVLVTEERQIAYRLACGLIATGPEHLGGHCSACLEELKERANNGDPQLAGLSLSQLEWSTVVHRINYRRCSEPFCEVGGCPRHIGRSQTGRLYCLAHFPDPIPKAPRTKRFAHYLHELFFGGS